VNFVPFVEILYKNACFWYFQALENGSSHDGWIGTPRSSLSRSPSQCSYRQPDTVSHFTAPSKNPSRRKEKVFGRPYGYSRGHFFVRYWQAISCFFLIQVISNTIEIHRNAGIAPPYQGDYNVGVTSGLIHRQDRRRFRLFVRVTYSQNERQLVWVTATFGPRKGCLSSCKWATRTNKWRQKTSPVFDESGSTVIESPCSISKYVSSTNTNLR